MVDSVLVDAFNRNEVQIVSMRHPNTTQCDGTIVAVAAVSSELQRDNTSWQLLDATRATVINAYAACAMPKGFRDVDPSIVNSDRSSKTAPISVGRLHHVLNQRLDRNDNHQFNETHMKHIAVDPHNKWAAKILLDKKDASAFGYALYHDQADEEMLLLAPVLCCLPVLRTDAADSEVLAELKQTELGRSIEAGITKWENFGATTTTSKKRGRTGSSRAANSEERLENAASPGIVDRLKHRLAEVVSHQVAMTVAVDNAWNNSDLRELVTQIDHISGHNESEHPGRSYVTVFFNRLKKVQKALHTRFTQPDSDVLEEWRDVIENITGPQGQAPWMPKGQEGIMAGTDVLVPFQTKIAGILPDKLQLYLSPRETFYIEGVKVPYYQVQRLHAFFVPQPGYVTMPWWEIEKSKETNGCSFLEAGLYKLVHNAYQNEPGTAPLKLNMLQIEHLDWTKKVDLTSDESVDLAQGLGIVRESVTTRALVPTEAAVDEHKDASVQIRPVELIRQDMYERVAKDMKPQIDVELKQRVIRITHKQYEECCSADGNKLDVEKMAKLVTDEMLKEQSKEIRELLDKIQWNTLFSTQEIEQEVDKATNKELAELYRKLCQDMPVNGSMQFVHDSVSKRPKQK